VRIIWNSVENRFEAELTPGPLWSQDKDAASQAKFSCTGPPAWIWYTVKPSVLTALQANRPTSGLTITPEALQNYQRLKAQSDANAAVRAQLEIAKKAQKKARKYAAEMAVPGETDVEHGEFTYLRVEPRESRIWADKYTPPVPPSLHCHVCQTPVYFYECQNPPTCLNCEIFPNLV
jgi:hypothetical protein